MGSTTTPLTRKKSLKIRLDELAPKKPSIKITVSSDALAETLRNNVSPSLDNDEGSGSSGENNDQQQPALIQIVGNCCSTSDRGGNNSNSNIQGANKSSSITTKLCSCENGDDKRTRIALDDFTVLEFPSCIDFGIKDFLCCKDDIELDLSSDTDASYLDATPPHRFSDSELENQIEAMSITLDTQLNRLPSVPLDDDEKDEPDDEDEETTEESFIMDEEEGSSTSNSAATIWGGGASVDLEQEANVSQDDPLEHIFINDSEVEVERAKVKSISESTSVEEEGEKLEHNDNEMEGQMESCNEVSISGNAEVTTQSDDDNQEQSTPSLSSPTVEAIKGDCSNATLNNVATTPLGENCNTDHAARQVTSTTKATMNASIGNFSISRKMLKHPTKHFKRQISLPASIFMSYLLEQNNKTNYSCNKQQQQPQLQNSCHFNLDFDNTHHQKHIIVKNALNRSNSCSKNNGSIVFAIRQKPLSKAFATNSKTVLQGSSEDIEGSDDNDDNHNSNTSHTNASYSTGNDGGNEAQNMQIQDNDNDDRNGSPSISKSGSFAESFGDSSLTDSVEESRMLDFTDNDTHQAFTSEVEKRSLILRHVRRLIRQDTTGNFAPPDFSI